MRMMNRVIALYVLALHSLFHFIACVCFYFFLFFLTTWLGIEISLSMLKIKQGVVPRFLSGVSRVELLQPYLV